jgi:hypothetical protein
MGAPAVKAGLQCARQSVIKTGSNSDEKSRTGLAFLSHEMRTTSIKLATLGADWDDMP